MEGLIFGILRYFVLGKKKFKKKQQRLSLSPPTSLRASSPGVPWDTAKAPLKSLLARYPRTRPSYLTLK